MIKSRENYGFLVFGFIMLVQLFFIHGEFMSKIAGLGIGIILTICLMIICGMADFTKSKPNTK